MVSYRKRCSQVFLETRLLWVEPSSHCDTGRPLPLPDARGGYLWTPFGGVNWRDSGGLVWPVHCFQKWTVIWESPDTCQVFLVSQEHTLLTEMHSERTTSSIFFLTSYPIPVTWCNIQFLALNYSDMWFPRTRWFQKPFYCFCRCIYLGLISVCGERFMNGYVIYDDITPFTDTSKGPLDCHGNVLKKQVLLIPPPKSHLLPVIKSIVGNDQASLNSKKAENTIYGAQK